MQASAQKRALSSAVHAAGLALEAALAAHNGTAFGAKVARALRPLPTYHGYGWVNQSVAAADVAGLIEAHREASEVAANDDLVRIAVAAMEAALLVLGLDPTAKREPVVPVVGNIEKFGRDEEDYAPTSQTAAEGTATTNHDGEAEFIARAVEIMSDRRGNEPSRYEHPLEPMTDQLAAMARAAKVVEQMASDDGDDEYAAVAAGIAHNLAAALDGCRLFVAREVERCSCGRCAERPALAD
jgi:hypothetical protein